MCNFNKIIIGTKGGGKRRKPSGPNLDQNWIMEFPRTLPNIWEVLLAQEGRLPYPNAANENIEQELLSKLLQVPLFYQAYEPQALVADDFAGFPPVVETRKSFISAMHELEELMEPMTTDRRSSIDIR
jgi:hypothetical protein